MCAGLPEHCIGIKEYFTSEKLQNTSKLVISGWILRRSLMLNMVRIDTIKNIILKKHSISQLVNQ